MAEEPETEPDLRERERFWFREYESLLHREGNRVLSRRGEFWGHEGYDRYIRDHEEWQRTIDYGLKNPVKGGLVRHWREWKWSYVAQDGIL